MNRDIPRKRKSPVDTHNSERIKHSRLTRLSKILGKIDVDDLINIFDKSMDFFNFDLTRHNKFSRAFSVCWQSEEFENIAEEDNSENKEIHAICCTNNVKGYEILYTRLPKANIRFIMDRAHYITLLCAIFIETNWRNEVDGAADIPPSLHRGIKLTGSKILKIFFPNLKYQREDELPDYIEGVICSQRVAYYKETISIKREVFLNPDNNNNNTVFEADDLGNNESGYWSDSSNITDNSSFSDGDKETIKYYANGFKMIPEDSLVIQRRLGSDSTIEESIFAIHPYSISAFVFAISVEVSNKISQDESITKERRNEWSARRLYMFFKDWLADQVKIWTFCHKRDMPSIIIETAQAILFYLTKETAEDEDEDDEKEEGEIGGYSDSSWEECSSDEKNSGEIAEIEKTFAPVFEFFRDVYQLLKYHIIRRTNSSVRIPRGRFQAFNLISEESMNDIILQEFHSYQPQTTKTTVEPSCFHIDKKHLNEMISESSYNKPGGKPMETLDGFDVRKSIIWFYREFVNPLQLYCSLQIMEIRFKHLFKCAFWRVFFSDDRTFLFLDSECLHIITQYIIPYLAGNRYLISRQLSFPMYGIHLYNFFRGTPAALVYTMKFVLRCFAYTKDLDTYTIPINNKDPVIDFYRILSEIMDRVGSRERIWKMLIDPLKNTSLLWFSSNSIGVKRKFFINESKQDKKSNKKNIKTFLKLTNAHKSKKIVNDMINEQREKISNELPVHRETKTSKIYGLNDASPSIYTALRSFIQVYMPHKILTNTLKEVFEFFNKRKKEMKNRCILTWAWKLIVILYHSNDLKLDWIPIPYKWEDVIANTNGYFTDQAHANQEFPFPPHIILYYLCTVPDLPDALAEKLFISIDINPQKLWACKNGKATYLRFSSATGRNRTEDKSRIERLLNTFIEKSTVTNEIQDVERELQCSEAIYFLFQSLEELSQYPASGITYDEFTRQREVYNSKDRLKDHKTIKEKSERYRGYVTEGCKHNIGLCLQPSVT